MIGDHVYPAGGGCLATGTRHQRLCLDSGTLQEVEYQKILMRSDPNERIDRLTGDRREILALAKEKGNYLNKCEVVVIWNNN